MSGSEREGSVWDEEVLAERLEGVLRALEKVRLQVLERRRKGWRALGLAGLAAVVLALGLSVVSPPAGFVGLAGFAFAAVIIYGVYFGSGQAEYRGLYKREVIGGMVRAVSPGMSFQPERGISEGMFNHSGLYSSPDRYHGEDLFAGRIGETELLFSEVHAEERRTSTDSKGRTRTYYVTTFRGIFMVADFHKHFHSELAVLPDVAERSFGWLGRKLQNLGGNVQRMENPEFEQAFVVRGRDAVEARYILTPAMQERLLALRGRLGEDVRFAFKDSKVFLGFSNKDDWFEADLMRPAEDTAQMRIFLGQMACCFNIVQDLDLNTRIWTKD